MCVQVEYKLATKFQIQQTFLRFFEHRFIPSVVSNAINAANPDKSSSSSQQGAESEKLDPEEASKSKTHTLPTTETTTHESITISLPTPPSSASLRNIASLSAEEIHALAEQFSSIVPEGTFSLAQIQGYMLMKKADPHGAVEDAADWVEKQMEERRKLEELKAKRKQKAKERAEAARKRAAEMAAKAKVEADGGAETQSEAGGDESDDAKEEDTDEKEPRINGMKESAATSVAETYETAASGQVSEDESPVAL
jgi:hypothetical protein